MANSLPPIPTPPAQLWREFRISMLPLIVFLGTIALVMMLWRQYVVPVTVLGMVQTNVTAVISTVPGLLSNVTVKSFDLVTNGQPLATVVVYDPGLVEASVRKVRSEAMVFGERMEINLEGRRQAIAGLESDLLNAKTALNQDQVSLTLAQSNLLRQTELYNSNIISAAAWETASNVYAGLKGQIADRSNLVQKIDKWLAQLAPSVESNALGMANIVQESILDAQEEIRQTMKPVVLTAPVSGRVSLLARHSGERVRAGEVVVAITPTSSDKIIAYVRQPILHYPQVGDVVTVRLRSPKRTAGRSQVIHVGSQLEQIGIVFTPWVANKNLADIGLPIAVSMPAGFTLLPGELVDVMMQR